MLGSNVLIETTNRTRTRGVSRWGTLCGVLVMVTFIGGCPPGPAACTENADCGTDLVCDTASGSCVECLLDTDCTDPKGLCNQGGGNVCVNCYADVHCDDGSVCTTNDKCGANFQCTYTDAEDDTDCSADEDPANACTNDACTAGVCTHTASGATTCNDGDDCTKDDACTALVCAGTDIADCCATNADCDAGDECVNKVCKPISTEFGVSIDDCPSAAVAANGPVNLTASVDNASTGGRLVYTWTVEGAGAITGNTDATPETVTFTTGGSSATVTVSVQDNSVANGPDTLPNTADDVLTPVGDPVTAECEVRVSVVQELTVDAGADRVAVALPTGFVSGGTIVGPTGPNPPRDLESGFPYDLVANATDPEFTDDELTYTWELLSAPTEAAKAAVTISQVHSRSTDLTLLSVTGSSLPAILGTGLSATIVGAPVPGAYKFKVTVVNPDDSTADDDVVVTYVPLFIINPAVPSAQGLAHSPKGVTNFVAQANTVLKIDPVALTATPGTLSFAALNANGSNAAAVPGGSAGTNPDVPLLPAVVLPGSTTAQNVTVDFVVATPDTYNLAAQFVSGVNSAAQKVLAPGGFPVNVHVQPSPLPSTVTINPGTQIDIGVVSPDTIGPGKIAVHGYRATSGPSGAYAGEVIVTQDLYGDLRPEVVVFSLLGVGPDGMPGFAGVNDDGIGGVDDVGEMGFGDDGPTWTIHATTTADPELPSTSPVNNSVNNDGVPGDAAGVAPVAIVTQISLPPAYSGAPVTDVLFADLDGLNGPEMIVGDPFALLGAGQVLVFFYTDTAVAFGANPYTAAPVVITDISPSTGVIDAMCGYSVAVGNLVNDSAPDIAIGCPGWDDNTAGGFGDDEGRVLVIDGGPLTPGLNVSVDTAGTQVAAWYSAPRPLLATLGSKEATGLSVGILDFKGDSGFLELAIGSPGRDHQAAPPAGDGLLGTGDDVPDVGEVAVVSGPVSGKPASAFRTFRGPEGTPFFGIGARLRGGNVTASAAHDIVVSAVGGAALPFPPGMLLVVTNTVGNGDIPTSVPQRKGDGSHIFGARFAIGDFNHDGFGDILIADDDTTATAIDRVHLVHGSSAISSALASNTTLSLVGTAAGDAALINGFPLGILPAGSPLDVAFAPYVAFGDVNGDSIADLLWCEDTVGSVGLYDRGSAIMGTPPPPPPAAP